MSKIKRFIKKIILSFIPLKKIMLLESNPNVSDNTKAVFDEMISRGLNKKYKMIWVVNGEYLPKTEIKNVFYVNRKSKWGKIKLLYYNVVAKCLISCNSVIRPYKKKQFSMYLSHSTTVKSVRAYYTIPKSINYFLVASEGVKDIQSYEFNYDRNKMVALGFPRNDVLTQPPIDVKKVLETDCTKVIVWYPTYRQHRGGLVTAVKNALPIISDAEFAIQLNECAKNNNTLIVLKPHFAQDVSYVKDLNLSNILFINDDFFVKKNITSYQFVSACDALITDYSSIYFDYTLCNKPIAVIWEDLEDYKKFPGLIDNYEEYLIGAEKVYDIDELKGFIERVANNEDLLFEERTKIRDLVNVSTDGCNSKRVVDFILEKISK